MTVKLMKYESVYFALAVRANYEGVVAGSFPSAMTSLRLSLTLPLMTLFHFHFSFNLIYAQHPFS